jgi:hypothetical protein
MDSVISEDPISIFTYPGLIIKPMFPGFPSQQLIETHWSAGHGDPSL